METTKLSKAERNKGRREFLFLIAIFFLPIIIVLVLYNNLDKWDIGGGKNNGDLIEPPRQLQDVDLQDPDGKSFVFSTFRDKWLMIVFGESTCGEQCKEQLYLMRQIRLAQGGNSVRIKRIYISTSGAPSSTLLELIKSEHSDLQLVYGSDAKIEQVIGQFKHDVGQGEKIQALYLADPRGFLMMSYPEGYDPKGTIQDMERLLKFARSG